MNIPLTTLSACLLHALLTVANAADKLMLYPSVPGLAASEHYQVRVRAAVEGGEWRGAFAFLTNRKDAANTKEGYFDYLAGWTHNYVNFLGDGEHPQLGIICGRGLRC